MIVLNPVGPFKQLSPWEQQQIQQRMQQGSHPLLIHHCALAVLYSGCQTDDRQQLLSSNPNFSIQLLLKDSGLYLRLINPPSATLVGGKLIESLRIHLFSLVRDLLLIPAITLPADSSVNPSIATQQITHEVFDRLRQAQVLTAPTQTPLVVCWGGHAIQQEEYRYAQQVGYELGLRGFHIVTGGGAGAMKAPLKGAAVGHARQGFKVSRFIGLTEPSIIAAEPPNVLINQLVVLPDIEKRLEAFVRLAQGIIIFPGGPGTAEELLYLLGILMHSDNQQQPLPLILTGPPESAAYWQHLEQFIQETLGTKAQQYYQLIVGDAATVAHALKQSIEQRDQRHSVAAFNSNLVIPYALQRSFHPTHTSMAQLQIQPQQCPSERAILLRQLFSGIVAGNIRQESIQAVAEKGPFRLQGDRQLMQAIDHLLKAFIRQQRMKLSGTAYTPCYEIAH